MIFYSMDLLLHSLFHDVGELPTLEEPTSLLQVLLIHNNYLLWDSVNKCLVNFVLI